MKLGIDNIDKYLSVFAHKKVGLITNPTGVNSNLVSTIDVLKTKVDLRCLFAPEHGVRGEFQAGVQFTSYTDPDSGVIVHSLYTKDKKPTKEMLDDVDIVCIDIQDVGSRFYTYIYTMAYSMMACQEFNKQFVVFDRPNPLGGEDCEGNILDLNYRSFIGYYPIIQRHGMTIGELAKMFNERFAIGVNLVIIPMEGYKRQTSYHETKLSWITPSPNIPTIESSYAYNGTCIFEGTNLSEGRGTTKPFEYVGAPYIKQKELAQTLNDLALPGVTFGPVTFTPMFSKHSGLLCKGVQLHITNYNDFKPVRTGWAMLYTISKLYPNEFAVLPPYKQGGNRMLELNMGLSYEKIKDLSLEEWFKIIAKDEKIFALERKQYLLY